MNTTRRHAVAALIAAGLLWGTTVPLSKLALEWLAPGWLTAVRFGLAAAVLLPVARRRAAVGIRGDGSARVAVGGRRDGSPRSGGSRILEPKVVLTGAVGYGGSVIVQNAGIVRTSVTHAALLIGAVPVLVAVIAALWQRSVARPVAWLGFAVSLGGVGLVTAGGGGGGASLRGDGLVLVSLVLSATFTVAQARLLPGRDPIVVTAGQFLGAALGALAFAVVAEGAPAVPGHVSGPVLAAVALALAGTLVPFTLFAYGQSRVPAEVAGAFLNIEPLVGAIAGVMFFGDPVGPKQLAGGLAVVLGILLSAISARSGEVRAEQGEVGGREPVAGGLGLMPVGVDEWQSAGLVEPGPLIGGQLERRYCEVVG
jgi:O-acetylserine/cysteine efflux transporter